MDKESQARIDRVLLFDEKIESLSQLEIQLKSRILNMQKKIELVNEQVKEQHLIGENSNQGWVFVGAQSRTIVFIENSRAWKDITVLIGIQGYWFIFPVY